MLTLSFSWSPESPWDWSCWAKDLSLVRPRMTSVVGCSDEEICWPFSTWKWAEPSMPLCEKYLSAFPIPLPTVMSTSWSPNIFFSSRSSLFLSSFTGNGSTKSVIYESFGASSSAKSGTGGSSLLFSITASSFSLSQALLFYALFSDGSNKTLSFSVISVCVFNISLKLTPSSASSLPTFYSYLAKKSSPFEIGFFLLITIGSSSSSSNWLKLDSISIGTSLKLSLTYLIFILLFKIALLYLSFRSCCFLSSSSISLWRWSTWATDLWIKFGSSSGSSVYFLFLSKLYLKLLTFLGWVVGA